MVHRHVHHHIHYHQDDEEGGGSGSPLEMGGGQLGLAPSPSAPQIMLSDDERRRIEEDSEGSIQRQLQPYMQGQLTAAAAEPDMGGHEHQHAHYHVGMQGGGAPGALEDAQQGQTQHPFAQTWDPAAASSSASQMRPAQMQPQRNQGQQQALPVYSQSVQRAVNSYSDMGRPVYAKTGSCGGGQKHATKDHPLPIQAWG